MNYIRLGDIVDIRDGTHDSPKYVLEGYPLVTSKNLSTGKIDLLNVNYITEEDFNQINKRSEVCVGDILLPMIGTVGNPVIVDIEEPFAIKNVALFKNNDKIQNSYLLYLLNSDVAIRQFEANKRGGTQKFVSLTNIRNLQVPLPELQTQRKISQVLDKAQELIDLRKKQIELLDDLIESVFYDMFGDPVTNPKGWEVKKIEDICEKDKNSIKAGPFGSALKKEYYVESGYKIYGQEQVINNDFSFGDYYIDEYRYITLESCKINTGDILISMVGTFGKISIVPKVFEPGIINPRLMKITLDKEVVFPKFLKSLLTSQRMIIKIKNMSHGGTMGIINTTKIRNLEVIVPDIELQHKYIVVMDYIMSQKQLMQQSLTEMENNFNSLMQRAFKGELFN